MIDSAREGNWETEEKLREKYREIYRETYFVRERLIYEK